MIMNEEWKQILADYNKAKHALWCPKNASSSWFRDEETGHYYMWKAYHHARTAESKDYLIYARILSMMASEYRIEVFDYGCYHKYIKPAVEAYHLAIKAGQHPSDKELDRIYFNADKLEYELNKREAPYEEQLSYISDHELLSDFEFHDSRFVSFEHTGNKAFLKLDYDGRVATFMFEDVEDVQTYFNSDNLWVYDFCCYPTFNLNGIIQYNGIVFDIELYRIICAKVTVVSCVT